MGVYYNEYDPFAAEWLRNLIHAGLLPEGDVDERRIQEVCPADLVGYSQYHFFAGIGGWPIALRLAGWPDDRPCWTGSCPCQPFSAAGKQKAQADERHLWPEFYRLIRECRPPVILGEQVEGAIGHGLLDGVFLDLEGEGYACGAAVLPAAGCGAPHIRHRIFWVSELPDANSPGCQGQRRTAKQEDGTEEHPGRGCSPGRHPDWLGSPSQSGLAGRAREPGNNGSQCKAAQRAGGESNELANLHGPGQYQHGQPHGDQEQRQQQASRRPDSGGCGEDAVAQGDSIGERIRGSEHRQDERETPGVQGKDEQRQRLRTDTGPASDIVRSWDDYLVVHCTDGKSRRIPVEPGDEPLSYGLPKRLGSLLPLLEFMGYDAGDLRRLGRNVSRNRIGRLKGYGNAIVPAVAAVFIQAFLQTEKDMANAENSQT